MTLVMREFVEILAIEMLVVEDFLKHSKFQADKILTGLVRLHMHAILVTSIQTKFVFRKSDGLRSNVVMFIRFPLNPPTCWSEGVGGLNWA